MEKLSPEAAAAWAGQETFLPYAYYADFPGDACRAYRAAQIRSLAGHASHHAYGVAGAGGCEAALGITTLGWDTEQLGVPAGRMDYLILKWPEGGGRPGELALAATAAGALVRAADGLGIVHLSARFDSRDLILIQALETAGFQLVDAILRFSLRSNELVIPGKWSDGVTLREAGEKDIPALADLAGRGFIYDRFHNDPLLKPGVADRVHAAWLTNAVRGKTGDGVLMAEVDGRPAGFFILSLDREAGRHFGRAVGTLVLITVDSNLRRRGVARALSLGSAAWLREKGADRFEVGTQLANVPAANVYLKAGFRLVQTSVSLRRMAV